MDNYNWKDDIEIMKNENEYIVFSTSCLCGTPDHVLQIWIEYDKKFDDISMNLYANTCWSDYNRTKSFIGRIWRRITCVLRMLFTGRIEVEHNFMFRNKEQLEAFNKGIMEAIKKIDNHK